VRGFHSISDKLVPRNHPAGAVTINASLPSLFRPRPQAPPHNWEMLKKVLAAQRPVNSNGCRISAAGFL
jgi:hypothetical protein